ncbi:hypothetical protein ACPR111641_04595 [Acinetobacter pragensis]|uniref:Uncharacterized protein n=1 Tax=Acinetobacter pragensis TaxID=1806892 RepID=A0A151Y1U0_9GAMM|nr:hypothetical protein AZH43_12125 [Acinetobacter pragensis]
MYIPPLKAKSKDFYGSNPLPILAAIMTLHDRSLENIRVRFLAISALVFYCLYTMTLNIHYMIISCLIMPIARVLYIFSNSYFQFIYLGRFLLAILWRNQ